MGEILRSPPVAQAAGIVEERAFAVEGMADRVPHPAPRGAVIEGLGPRWVEIRRLQDGGGEVERVHRGQVHGVDQLRVHHPFAAVDWLAEAPERALQFELLRALEVPERVAADYLKTRIVAPFVRVA